MKQFWAILVTVFFLSTSAYGETIGLGFIVQEKLVNRAKIEKMVDELNSYFINSQVNIQAQVVSVTDGQISETDPVKILDQMAREEGSFANLFQKATESGADFTFALTNTIILKGKAICGRAYAVNKTLAEISSIRRAFAVINPVCGAHTLAHELGHMMGLNHGSLVDQCQPHMGHTTAMLPYANGYGVGNCDGKKQPGEFGDIMVGGWMGVVLGNDKASLPFFSNARLHDPRCGTAQQCGDPVNGDAARFLNEHAHLYARHKLSQGSREPPLEIKK